jgi:hypothetical protein
LKDLVPFFGGRVGEELAHSIVQVGGGLIVFTLIGRGAWGRSDRQSDSPLVKLVFRIVVILVLITAVFFKERVAARGAIVIAAPVLW